MIVKTSPTQWAPVEILQTRCFNLILKILSKCFQVVYQNIQLFLLSSFHLVNTSKMSFEQKANKQTQTRSNWSISSSLTNINQQYLLSGSVCVTVTPSALVSAMGLSGTWWTMVCRILITCLPIVLSWQLNYLAGRGHLLITYRWDRVYEKQWYCAQMNV